MGIVVRAEGRAGKGERRLGGTADIGRIADQLAEMPEREVTYRRD